MKDYQIEVRSVKVVTVKAEDIGVAIAQACDQFISDPDVSSTYILSVQDSEGPLN